MRELRNIGAEVRSLLLSGEKPTSISKRLNCSKSTITYHAKKIGLKVQSRPEYDWRAISDFRNSGHTVLECIEKFGFCRASWCKAVKRGQVISHERILMPLDILLTPGRVKTSRNSVKRRLLKAGLLEKKCALCGITEWRGNPLSFNLDHIDGYKLNWSLINLRMVCPNCDSQQDTFSGRNVRRLANLARLEAGVIGNIAGLEPVG